MPFYFDYNGSLIDDDGNPVLYGYGMYLRSKEWRDLRRKKLEQENYTCQVCKIQYEDKDLQVHHRTYKRVGHEKLSDLEVRCDRCHSSGHGYSKPISTHKPTTITRKKDGTEKVMIWPSERDLIEQKKGLPKPKSKEIKWITPANRKV